jgi:aldose 1-epimerase
MNRGRPSDKLLCIHGDRYAALIAPHAGGRIASLTFERDGSRRDLLVPLGEIEFDAHHWPKAGAFPMVPFTNRMQRGGVHASGRHGSPALGPHGFAQHGFAHRAAWTVDSIGVDTVGMSFNFEGDALEWPWPWIARQRIEVGSFGLRLTLSVENTGAVPMPLSMGWHPYFPIDAAAMSSGVDHFAERRFDLDEEGRAVRPRPASNVQLSPGETAAFGDWTGTALIGRPDGLRCSLTCTGADHLVVHRPHLRSYVCVEPVSVLPGGLAGTVDTALMVAPGAIRELKITCAAVD